MGRQLVSLLVLLSAVLVPVAAEQAGGDVNPKKAIAQAHAAMQGGRLQEALALYSAVVANQSRDAAKFKADALYGVALVRLSADKSVADVERARAALDELTKLNPTYERRQESAAFIQLLDEMNRRVDEERRTAAQAVERAERAVTAAKESSDSQVAALQKRADDLTQKLAETHGQIDSTKGDTDKLRQEAATLRSENRTLRDQLTKAQADLQKKDAALRKIAGSIVKSPR